MKVKCIENYLSRKYDKDIIVLTSSLYEATKYYNYIGIYNDNSYIFIYYASGFIFFFV